MLLGFIWEWQLIFLTLQIWSMKIGLKIIIALLIGHVVQAQKISDKVLNGKVVSEAVNLDGIYVINLNTDQTATTANEGFFTINASVGDTLMFAALPIKGLKRVITEADFNQKLTLVKLEPMIHRLNEVVIKQYKHINAVDLGIVAPTIKKYTPAERRLRTANGDGIEGNTDGSSGASVGLDPLFNWMSGRTALLKKELEVERKETLLQRIENQFGISYCIDKLKIPADYVKGFWYYIVDEPKFVAAMKTKNKVMTAFVLAELATKYISLQQADAK
jgi:hypothetical protein